MIKKLQLGFAYLFLKYSLHKYFLNLMINYWNNLHYREFKGNQKHHGFVINKMLLNLPIKYKNIQDFKLRIP
jgi:hypothetical protein